MASCPKCGKPKIRKRKGVRKCPWCGPLPSFQDRLAGRTSEDVNTGSNPVPETNGVS